MKMRLSITLLAILLATPVWATSPDLPTFNSTIDADGTSTVVNMPASATTGDLVVVACAHKAANLHTISSGTNWTTRDQGTFNTATRSYSAFMKVLDGTGDNLTVAATAGNTVCGSARATGHAVTAPATHTERGISNATSASPDPPNAALTFGSQDFTVLAIVWSDTAITYGPFSSGYTEGVQAKGAGSAVSVLMEFKKVTAGTSDDAGTLTADASHPWLSRAYTIPSTLTGGAASTCNGGLPLLGVGAGC